MEGRKDRYLNLRQSDTCLICQRVKLPTFACAVETLLLLLPLPLGVCLDGRME